MKNEKPQTDFGYTQVPWEEKAQKVKAVFASVANNYDLMNNLMSFGIHHIWKRYAVALSGVKKGDRVLDLAGGTGDLTLLFDDLVGQSGEVILSDINAAMLEKGRDRLINQGKIHIKTIQANAESLPFPSDYFDCITIGFGLRNVTDKSAALASMYRCLKPGGRLIVLDFSHPESPLLKKAYDLYSFTVLPFLGNIIANDAESYQYLAESIRMHPNQETLKNLILTAGFDDCDYHNLTGGIVACHRALKV